MQPLSGVDGTQIIILLTQGGLSSTFLPQRQNHLKMSTRIRLQRHGRKNYAFYSIVIADANAPRDGRFTEKIGTYNPNTNPATVDLNFERALYWVLVGAQPTDTVRNILSGEGVYLKKHLLGGVKKGAFDEAAADAKFEAWKKEKDNKLAAAQNKKAQELLDQLWKKSAQYLQWYCSLDATRFASSQRECMIQLYIMNQLLNLQDEVDKSKSDQKENLLQSLSEIYYSKGGKFAE